MTYLPLTKTRPWTTSARLTRNKTICIYIEQLKSSSICFHMSNNKVTRDVIKSNLPYWALVTQDPLDRPDVIAIVKYQDRSLMYLYTWNIPCMSSHGFSRNSPLIIVISKTLTERVMKVIHDRLTSSHDIITDLTVDVFGYDMSSICALNNCLKSQLQSNSISLIVHNES